MVKTEVLDSGAERAGICEVYLLAIDHDPSVDPSSFVVQNDRIFQPLHSLSQQGAYCALLIHQYA